MRVVIGTFWSVVFAAIGLGAGAAIRLLPVMHHTDKVLWPLIGVVAGLAVFNWMQEKGWLPGLRLSRNVRPGSGPRWGIMQAIWLLLGFILMQGVGVFGCSAIAILVADLSHIPAPPNNLITDTIAGYLTATLWSVWYIGRQGPAKIHDGSPSGIAWRPAVNQAYVTAILFAGVIIMAMVIIIHFSPPNLALLKNLPSAKLFQGSALATGFMMILAVFIAPPVEEYVFRGGIFSALASRVSPLWAGIITTLLFMAVHAPEKYAYPPGFIGVGLMAAAAAWMRVKFSSIKPGILLHFIYNAGLILASGLSG